MELTQLKRFVLVATLLNVSRAAERTHVSQSALSLTLKALEEELGFLLFERVGRRMMLTPRGKRFLEKVKPLIADLEEMKEQVSRDPEDQREKVVVAAGPTMINFLLPYLADFLAKHPDIDLRFTTGQSVEIFHQLENEEADFAISRYAFFPASFKGSSLFSEGYVLILNKKTSLQVKWRPTLQEIARLPLCIRFRPFSTGYRELISTFKSDGIMPYVACYTHSNESACRAVRYNPNWVGLVTACALTEHDLEWVDVRNVSHLFPSREIRLLRRRNASETKVRIHVDEFLRTLPWPRFDPKGNLIFGLSESVII